MKSPLELISIWFNSVNHDTQEDFTGLASLYMRIPVLLDNDDILKADDPKLLKDFLSPKKKVNSTNELTRVLAIKGFISFTLESRDSEKDWEQAKQRNEIAAQQIGSTHLDNFLSSYENRKNTWIKWANDWYKLVSNELCDESLAHWYWSNL